MANVSVVEVGAEKLLHDSNTKVLAPELKPEESFKDVVELDSIGERRVRIKLFDVGDLETINNYIDDPVGFFDKLVELFKLRTITPNFDYESLYLAEFEYFLMQMRVHSLGQEVTVTAKCDCTRTITEVVNLTNLDISPIPKYYTPLVIDMGGQNVTLDLPTVKKHKANMAALSKDTKPFTKFIDICCLYISKIEGVDKGFKEVSKFIRSVKPKDLKQLKDFVIANKYGVNTTCKYTCLSCKAGGTLQLPFSAELFQDIS